jgi:hypothetical protein
MIPPFPGRRELDTVSPPALHETQIARVIDDAGEIRVLVIDAHRHDVAAAFNLAIDIVRPQR